MDKQPAGSGYLDQEARERLRNKALRYCAAHKLGTPKLCARILNEAGDEAYVKQMHRFIVNSNWVETGQVEDLAAFLADQPEPDPVGALGDEVSLFYASESPERGVYQVHSIGGRGQVSKPHSSLTLLGDRPGYARAVELVDDPEFGHAQYDGVFVRNAHAILILLKDYATDLAKYYTLDSSSGSYTGSVLFARYLDDNRPVASMRVRMSKQRAPRLDETP